MPPKNMTQEDRDLWAWITRDIAPLGVERTRKHENQPKLEKQLKHTQTAEPAQKSGRKFDVQAKIDRRTTRKLAKGDLKIDAKLDLHGKTQDEAHKSLARFIIAARKRGVRVALVVTGKGAGGAGVLRRNVPLWLENPDVAPHVLQYAEARPEHGGAGALYVLIQKLT